MFAERSSSLAHILCVAARADSEEAVQRAQALRSAMLAADPAPAGLESASSRLTATMSRSTSAAALLVEALPFARLESIPGQTADGSQILALYNARGDAVNWPNLTSHRLLIRPVFREFFERPDMFNRGRQRTPRTDQRNSLVRGIPGIGKSSFGLYCLWRLVTQEQRHVMYDYPKGLGERDFDMVEVGTGPHSEAVYIADGRKPRVAAGIVLLVTSPRQDFFDEFQKDAHSFFMPEPTEEEMRLMRDACFPDRVDELTDEVIDARITQWGRVPRRVLGAAAVQSLELRATLERLDEEPLRRLLQNKVETGFETDMAFRVIHYKFSFDTAAPYRWGAGATVGRDYSLVHLRWASPFMEDRIWDFLMLGQRQSRLELLSELFSDKAMLAFAGTLWEKWCRVALDRGSSSLPGGGFQIRRLSAGTSPATSALHDLADRLLGLVATGNVMLLPAPAATSVEFSSLENLKAQLATAGVPGAPRRFVAPPGFASIDFWEAQLKHPSGSNATVSANHALIVQGELRDNGWYAIASALGLASGNSNVAQSPIIHLWLVPSIIFPLSNAGKLVVADKKYRKSVPPAADAGSVTAAAVATAGTSAPVDGDTTPPQAAARAQKMGGRAGAARHAEAAKQEANRLAFNAAVDAANALAPRIVQYAVLVPTPAEWSGRFSQTLQSHATAL